MGVTHRRESYKIMNEYDEYLSTPSLEVGTVTNLVIWWGHHSGQWPNLSWLALDALSIPAMSAECGRSFSDAGRTITDERASLGPDAIEACGCVKNWLRSCDTGEIPGIGPNREGGEPRRHRMPSPSISIASTN